jgi:hypothetical protein
MEEAIRWQLVNPEGVVATKEFRVNPHPETLEGKTVMLRWNGKHNGDVLLNRVAEYLTENVQDVQTFKNWEVAPETATTTENQKTSQEFARKLASFKPDIVIASQGD